MPHLIEITIERKGANMQNDQKQNIKFENAPIEKIVTDPDLSLNWIRQQNKKTNAHMRHMLALAFLQEPQFSAERDHFYNEVHKRSGQEIKSMDDAELYVSKLLNERTSDTTLRDTAPGAVEAAKQYINSIDLDKTLQDVGYPLDRVTSELREHLQITQAYATRIGGQEGHKGFIATLKSQKDNFIKGLGDQRIGLAVSGSMLGMAVMAGAGPAGLVIGGLKFAQKLLDTDTGKKFQSTLFKSASSFMGSIGVNPEILSKVNNSIKDTWSKVSGTRWGKVAMLGAAFYVGSAITPEIGSAFASDVVPTTDPINLDNAPSLEDRVENHLVAHEKTHHSGELVGFMAHDIKLGDTLWDLAKEHFAEQHPGEEPNNIQIINMVNDIAEYNDIDKPNKIFAGQTIHFPQDLNPSSELVSGQTNWLNDENSNVSSRLKGLEERVGDWQSKTHTPSANETLSSLSPK